MDFVILDLEWNGSYSRKKKRYINEIIEFGAVKCDENLNITDSFKCLVKPQIAHRISSVITGLTHITNEKLDNGLPFSKALSLFNKWCSGSVVLTWGTSDILVLIENCKYFIRSDTVPFLKQYCDLQKYTSDELKIDGNDQLGLARAAELLDIKADETKLHRALGDSRLSLKVFEKVYDPEKFKSCIQLCDDEFYKRTTFKTAYIVDLQSPLLEKRDLKFACTKCGGPCKRNTSWKVKNKSLFANFTCLSCDYKFTGRLTIKQKYEELTVAKKTFPTPIIESPRSAESGKVGNMNLEICSNGAGLLKFPMFESQTRIKHAFSTRIGGVSKDEFAAMNLGFERGDPKENVYENFSIFAEAVGVDPDGMVAGAQDHHINIRRVDETNKGTGIWKEKDMQSIDGLCTSTAGISLIIYCSDCVPLYFYDPKNNAIGLAHAGWKGTAAGMAKAMTEKMQKEFGTDPSDLLTGIGPSISKESFEVDKPVADVFMQLDGYENFVEPRDSGKYHIDLWECNRQFMLSAGVSPDNISIGNVCTMQNSDLLFSHRKTCGKRGSNCAVLSLI